MKKIKQLFLHIGKNAFDNKAKHQDFYFLIFMFMFTLILVPFIFFMFLPMFLVGLLTYLGFLYSFEIYLFGMFLVFPWFFVWYRYLAKKLKVKEFFT